MQSQLIITTTIVSLGMLPLIGTVRYNQNRVPFHPRIMNIESLFGLALLVLLLTRMLYRAEILTIEEVQLFERRTVPG